MEVDNNTGYYRQRVDNPNLITPQLQHIKDSVSPHNLLNYISKPQYLNPNLQVSYKHNREQLRSDRSPFMKLQKVNYMPEEAETSSNRDELLSRNTDFEYDYYSVSPQNNDHNFNDDVVAEYGNKTNHRFLQKGAKTVRSCVF